MEAGWGVSAFHLLKYEKPKYVCLWKEVRKRQKQMDRGKLEEERAKQMYLMNSSFTLNFYSTYIITFRFAFCKLHHLYRKYGSFPDFKPHLFLVLQMTFNITTPFFAKSPQADRPVEMYHIDWEEPIMRVTTIPSPGMKGLPTIWGFEC